MNEVRVLSPEEAEHAISELPPANASPYGFPWRTIAVGEGFVVPAGHPSLEPVASHKSRTKAQHLLYEKGRRFGLRFQTRKQPDGSLLVVRRK